MSRKTAQRSRAGKSGRAHAPRRKRLGDHPTQSPLSDGAAAAERASAGMGTQDFEPTDWLFGGTLSGAEPRPY